MLSGGDVCVCVCVCLGVGPWQEGEQGDCVLEEYIWTG